MYGERNISDTKPILIDINLMDKVIDTSVSLKPHSGQFYSFLKVNVTFFSKLNGLN